MRAILLLLLMVNFENFQIENRSSTAVIEEKEVTLSEIDSQSEKAPAFTLKDSENKLHSLSDFEGKVVYISFWATWCKPCLMGFRQTVSIRNQLEDIGVVLLNVSLDESEITWQGTISRVPMPGINLYAGNDETLKLNYELSKLPSYYIVDKAGNLAYLPDGSRDVLEEFRKLVNE